MCLFVHNETTLAKTIASVSVSSMMLTKKQLKSFIGGKFLLFAN